MKILFIGTAASDKVMEKIYNHCNDRKPSMSSIVFDRNIATGLARQCDTEAFSLIVAPSFPACRKLYINSKTEKIDGLKVDYISYMNIPGLKYFIFEFKLFFKILHWNIKNRKEKKVIVLSANHAFFNRPASFLRNCFKTKIYSFFTDLPELEMSYSKQTSNLKKKLLSFYQRNNQKRNEKLDGYIFLTEHMGKKINKKHKPSIIVEGVINEKIAKNQITKKENAIMYAGTLNEKFGAKNLVDAFLRIEDDDLELWLYGYGDYCEEIQKAAKNDKRIKFFGQKDRGAILDAEKHVKLLINPRQNTDEYTKYSFPSKTMEYLASGTPVLMYKLDGIPDEYDNYIYYIKGNSINDLRNAIEEVTGKSQKELNEFGRKAKEWVLVNKNVETQTKKIIELIENDG